MYISLETLKMYQMYLEKKKNEHKHDINKSAYVNLSEIALIDIALEKVISAIKNYDECN
jgi:hypothetical protein